MMAFGWQQSLLIAALTCCVLGFDFQEKVVAPDAAATDYFGYAVAMSGDYAVVGSYQDDDAGSGSGSAYVFKRSGTVWSSETKLVAPDAAADDYFGKAVAISGDYAVVGSWTDDDGGSTSGSAYVFVFPGTGAPTTKTTAPTTKTTAPTTTTTAPTTKTTAPTTKTTAPTTKTTAPATKMPTGAPTTTTTAPTTKTTAPTIASKTPTLRTSNPVSSAPTEVPTTKSPTPGTVSPTKTPTGNPTSTTDSPTKTPTKTVTTETATTETVTTDSPTESPISTTASPTSKPTAQPTALPTANMILKARIQFDTKPTQDQQDRACVAAAESASNNGAVSSNLGATCTYTQIVTREVLRSGFTSTAVPSEEARAIYCATLKTGYAVAAAVDAGNLDCSTTVSTTGRRLLAETTTTGTVTAKTDAAANDARRTGVSASDLEATAAAAVSSAAIDGAAVTTSVAIAQKEDYTLVVSSTSASASGSAIDMAAAISDLNTAGLAENIGVAGAASYFNLSSLVTVTKAPTEAGTQAPTQTGATPSPTKQPTTKQPTTKRPTKEPTAAPTDREPTAAPTEAPTPQPTVSWQARFLFWVWLMQFLSSATSWLGF